MRLAVKGVLVGLVCLVHAAAWGGHPLITDDTGTQGKGRSQLELGGQYDADRERVSGVLVRSTGGQVAATLSHGLTDSADLVLGLPYQWARVREDGVTRHDERGLADTSLDLKWRFFEDRGLSLALKPGVRIPTGNEERGLGSGRVGHQLALVVSKQSDPWALHLNAGYIRNENRADEEKNLWHASAAATCRVASRWAVVGNIGIERNSDRAADRHPAFLIGGVVFSPSDRIDVDAGVKYGLTAPETDLALMAGIAFRF